MRDYRKLNAEIRLLIGQFGKDQVYWDSKGRWVMIKEWPLPDRLTKKKTHVIVLIPENYGNGERLRDAFVDPEIKAYNLENRRYEAIPHYFAKYPYARLILGNKEEWQQKGWQYVCLHEKIASGSHASILNYLSHLYKFLAEPFRDWNEIFSSYHGGQE